MAEWDPDLPLEEFPAELRALLTDDDADGIRRGVARVRGDWEALIERARELPEARLHESVGGEWSFVRTLRHGIYAVDTWFGRMVQGEAEPFHRWGQPFAEYEGVTDLVDLDLEAEPGLDEVLPVWRGRMDAVASTVADLTDADLDRVCTPEGPIHPTEPHDVRTCLLVVVEEAWWHHRFAERDLATLE